MVSFGSPLIRQAKAALARAKAAKEEKVAQDSVAALKKKKKK